MYARDSVGSLTFELTRSLKDTYDYPVAGWVWFDNEEAATAAMNDGTFDGSVNVSKLKLILSLEAIGKDEVLYSIINSDPTGKLLWKWNAASFLNTKDPMVVQLIPIFVAALEMTESDVMNLLRSCQ